MTLYDLISYITTKKRTDAFFCKYMNIFLFPFLYDLFLNIPWNYFVVIKFEEWCSLT